MSLTLTSQDQKRIARASRVIAAPFDFDTPDAWMEAAATSLREVVGASTASVSIPSDSGLRLMYPDFSDEVADQYRSFYPLLERVGTFRRSARSGVLTRREIFGQHYEAMQQSAYVQEFMHGIKCYDSITIGVRWSPRGTTPGDVLQVLLNTDDPQRPFDAAQAATARLLHPALEAGVSSYQRLRAAHAQLGALIDASGAACAVFSLGGQFLHGTPALNRTLAREPHRDRLMAQARHLARAFTRNRDSLAVAPSEPGTFVGARGPYRLVPTRVKHLGPRPSILLTVTPPRARSPLPTEGDVQEQFGLTPRQAEVALLLAARHSNKEIAAALGISIHTARHHVEHVLSRLDAARSDVPDVVGRIDVA
ncbi:MAG: helix-turn-helix transcriptional regulator [Rhodothermales bacterium]